MSRFIARERCVLYNAAAYDDHQLGIHSVYLPRRSTSADNLIRSGTGRRGCEDLDSGRAMGGRCPRLAAERGHGSWYLRLELWIGMDGRRRRVRRGGFPTRKAALEALVWLRGPAGSPLTVAEWLQPERPPDPRDRRL